MLAEINYFLRKKKANPRQGKPKQSQQFRKKKKKQSSCNEVFVTENVRTKNRHMETWREKERGGHIPLA